MLENWTISNALRIDQLIIKSNDMSSLRSFLRNIMLSVWVLFLKSRSLKWSLFDQVIWFFCCKKIFDFSNQNKSPYIQQLAHIFGWSDSKDAGEGCVHFLRKILDWIVSSPPCSYVSVLIEFRGFSTVNPSFVVQAMQFSQWLLNCKALLSLANLFFRYRKLLMPDWVRLRIVEFSQFLLDGVSLGQ